MLFNQNTNPYGHPGIGVMMDHIRWIAPVGTKSADVVARLAAHFPTLVFEVQKGGTIQHGAVYTSQQADGVHVSVTIYKFTCTNGDTCAAGHKSVTPTASPIAVTSVLAQALANAIGEV